ncbi:MAG: gamma-glutamyl-gamma-aminobutyrate hydrolase family protein [Alphaproteobacteria bacterium]|nr:gamma-glutamyl-gamma-aminobutyrate hydrolase family protein [Alphaproteobacteria bacterium]
MAKGGAPLIGLPACVIDSSAYTWHSVAEQYIRAVVAAGGIPVILPAIGPATDSAGLLARLDAVVLTGSSSNVEPARYGGPASREGTRHDAKRDATTLPLIRKIIDTGMPLLAICRGHQELNVALGGTLHQNVHELPGKRDHRAPRDQPHSIRYAPVHHVDLSGSLAELARGSVAQVNSLHAQSIDRLAPGLAIEAVSEDGVIEAVRVTDAKGFALGVQWHPEWLVESDALSKSIFALFGRAARDYAARR